MSLLHFYDMTVQFVYQSFHVYCLEDEPPQQNVVATLPNCSLLQSDSGISTFNLYELELLPFQNLRGLLSGKNWRPPAAIFISLAVATLSLTLTVMGNHWQTLLLMSVSSVFP